MTQALDAVFENGKFRLLEKPKVPLRDGQHVRLTVETEAMPEDVLELAGQVHDVLAAKSRTRTGVVRKSGTSMAAPATAGLVALVFAEAQARGLNLTINQTREVLTAAARRNPPPGGN